MGFSPVTNTQAYLKAGFLGAAGSGKTFTASALARGLVRHIKLDKPVYFLDSETGASWVAPLFAAEGIPLMHWPTRSWRDMMEAIDIAERDASVLLIDSLSHFGDDLIDGYLKKKKRQEMSMRDWSQLRPEKARLSDRFVNSAVHIITCGRLTFSYDYEVVDGRKELVKTDVKMQGVGDFTFEPSLVVEMERVVDIKERRTTRVAHILKDRASVIDGQDFVYEKATAKQASTKVLKDFLPHLKALNMGGEQLGFAAGSDTSALFADDVDTDAERKAKARERDIALDELKEAIVTLVPGMSADEKRSKRLLLESAFGTPSWVKIQKESSVGRIKVVLTELATVREKAEQDPEWFRGWLAAPTVLGETAKKDSATETGEPF